MDELNKIHHRDWMANRLPDKSVQLIIADPPYFEVRGAFDFAWEGFAHYLEDVERWAIECKRVLADNGTLFWWGDALKIAHTQTVIDKHLKILSNLVWEKGECQTLRNEVKMLRTFAPVTERLLMYHKGEDKSGLERIFDDPALFLPIKEYFDNWLDLSGYNLTEAVNLIGSSSSHWLGFTRNNKKTQFCFPTREKWDKMNELYPIGLEHEELKKQYEELKDEYEALRLEYEDLRRTFELPYIMGDVLHYSQESHITKNFDHETKKPELLTRMLINVSTKPGDLVLVPFAGSGTECAMAAKEGRDFIGFDIEPDYVEMGNKRTRRHLKQPRLF